MRRIENTLKRIHGPGFGLLPELGLALSVRAAEKPPGPLRAAGHRHPQAALNAHPGKVVFVSAGDYVLANAPAIRILGQVLLAGREGASSRKLEP